MKTLSELWSDFEPRVRDVVPSNDELLAIKAAWLSGVAQGMSLALDACRNGESDPEGAAQRLQALAHEQAMLTSEIRFG